MSDYIKHANQAEGEVWQARIYDDFGYNLIDPETGMRIGDKVKTFRYADPIHHPSDGSVLMRIKPVTRWRLFGGKSQFTKESPADAIVEGGVRDGQPVLSASEKSGMKTRDEWKAEGFFAEVIS